MTESFAQMFEESLASQRIRPGQILTGRVIDVGPDVVVVSAGLKSEAVIPVQQFKNERGEIEGQGWRRRRSRTRQRRGWLG
jgi:small subunit ribosomal protein S1